MKLDGEDWVVHDVEGSEKKYAQFFISAKKRYKEAVKLINSPSNATSKSYVQSEILAKCFDVNELIFPITLAEGLLDLKDVAAGIGAGAAGIPVMRDS